MGDVNNDGNLDLITAHARWHSLTILFGDGRGGFRQTNDSELKVRPSPGEIALGDVNGDGKLDLVISEHDSYDVTVLLGDGKGHFSEGPSSPFPASAGGKPHTHGLVLGDVNGDGRLDIVTANNADNNVSVLLGDGGGHFSRAPRSPFAIGPSPYPIALGDVNGDGHLDVVAPNSFDNKTVTILLGDGKGNFRPAAHSPFSVAPGPYFVAVGDLNRDRKLDIVVMQDVKPPGGKRTGLLTVLLGDGKGDFAASSDSPIRLGRPGWGLVIADVDRDGKMHIIAATSDSVTFLLGNGRGSFTAAPGSPFAAGKGTWRLAIGDVNRDGKLDVAASNLESNSVTVLLAK